MARVFAAIGVAALMALMNDYQQFRHVVKGVSDMRVLDTLVDLSTHRRSDHNERPQFKTSEVVFAFYQRYRVHAPQSVINLRLQRLCTNGLVERIYVRSPRKMNYWRPEIQQS